MEKKTFSSEVFGGGDYDNVPDKAEFVIRKDKAMDIIRLAGVVKANNAYKIEAFDYITDWFQGEECFDETETGSEERKPIRTDCNTLNVSDDQFWFAAYLKHTRK